ncbi:GroES-like protein [Hesseltinella vesiculosa]|uniref:GroES-like protein n=1 Tax=Hesseltinella vesiculosa TaxID=101127 RepID=A0A1X2GBL8_9FUNG|nr:GroES-like protein [Hesseltinella vesiculosa]
MSVPTSMNAIVLEKFGGPEVLKYKQVPTPQVKAPTDILVRVKAAGVNPVDAKLRAGNLMSFAVKKNAILGGDFAGVVVAKGTKVTDFEVGDAVMGKVHLPSGPQGTYAEYVLLTQNDKAVTKKPDYLSFEEAASYGIALITAIQALVVDKPLSIDPPRPGEPVPKVLVIGASGGVGCFGVQVGKAIGAEVVAICSGKNAEFVKGLGADRVVDYNDPAALDDLATETETYDVLFDLVGGDKYYNKLVHILKRDGVFTTAVGPSEHMGSEHVGFCGMLGTVGWIGRRKLFGARRFKMILSLPDDKYDWAMSKWFPDQKIKPFVSKENIIALQDVAEAHRRIETHRVTGKIILRVDSQ